MEILRSRSTFAGWGFGESDGFFVPPSGIVAVSCLRLVGGRCHLCLLNFKVRKG